MNSCRSESHELDANYLDVFFIKNVIMSMGRGKMIVEFCEKENRIEREREEKINWVNFSVCHKFHYRLRKEQ